VGSIRSYASKLATLAERDPFRAKSEAALVAKLFDMAILDASASVSQIDEKVTVSAFCRRRLAVVMVCLFSAQNSAADGVAQCKLKMCQSVKTATQFIEQGHVRVGPDTMTDPAFMVTRSVHTLA
jgi:U3 small nucleolar ribonucleoprotein protein IMP3